MTPLLLALAIHSGDPELTRAVSRAMRQRAVEVVGTSGLATERLDIVDDGPNRVVVRLTRGAASAERQLAFEGAPSLVDRAEAIALGVPELERRLLAASPAPSPAGAPSPTPATLAAAPAPSDPVLWPVERAPGGAGPPAAPPPRPSRTRVSGAGGVLTARDLTAVGGDLVAEYHAATPFVVELSAGVYQAISGRYGHTRLYPLDATFGIRAGGARASATLEGGAELLTAQTDPTAARQRDLDVLTAIVLRGSVALRITPRLSAGLRAGASYTSDDEQYETASGGQRNFPHLYLRGAASLGFVF